MFAYHSWGDQVEETPFSTDPRGQEDQVMREEGPVDCDKWQLSPYLSLTE